MEQKNDVHILIYITRKTLIPSNINGIFPQQFPGFFHALLLLRKSSWILKYSAPTSSHVTQKMIFSWIILSLAGIKNKKFKIQR